MLYIMEKIVFKNMGENQTTVLEFFLKIGYMIFIKYIIIVIRVIVITGLKVGL